MFGIEYLLFPVRNLWFLASFVGHSSTSTIEYVGWTLRCQRNRKRLTKAQVYLESWVKPSSLPRSSSLTVKTSCSSPIILPCHGYGTPRMLIMPVRYYGTHKWSRPQPTSLFCQFNAKRTTWLSYCTCRLSFPFAFNFIIEPWIRIGYLLAQLESSSFWRLLHKLSIPLALARSFLINTANVFIKSRTTALSASVSAKKRLLLFSQLFCSLIRLSFATFHFKSSVIFFALLTELTCNASFLSASVIVWVEENMSMSSLIIKLNFSTFSSRICFS